MVLAAALVAIGLLTAEGSVFGLGVALGVGASSRRGERERILQARVRRLRRGLPDLRKAVQLAQRRAEERRNPELREYLRQARRTASSRPARRRSRATVTQQSDHWRSPRRGSYGIWQVMPTVIVGPVRPENAPYPELTPEQVRAGAGGLPPPEPDLPDPGKREVW